MHNFHNDPLQAICHSDPNKVIGWRESMPMTQAQFLSKVSLWQQRFAPISQDKIALYLNDSLEFASALFAAWSMRKTVYLTADTLDINCRSIAQHVDIFIGEFPDAFQTDLELTAQENHQFNTFPVHTVSSIENNFLALVVHTSGSTGIPQAIPKKWSQLASEINTLETLFGEQLGSAIIFSTVSHHHIYGLLFKILWPMMSGRIIHSETLNFPEQFAEKLGNHRCTLIASPAHLKRLPDHINWDRLKTHLCGVFSSGGPLNQSTSEHVQHLWGCAPIEVFGSSETGGIAWRQQGAPQETNQEVNWQIFPNLVWRIYGDEQLLEICSPHLPDDQWYRHADRVEAIDASHFRLLGRQDRIVKIEEKRVSLKLIEQSLSASNLVEEIKIVINNDNSEHRQHIYAFIVLTLLGKESLSREGKLAINQKLREHLSDIVEPVCIPRRWRYLDALPINTQGKTTYSQLIATLNTELTVNQNLISKPTKPSWNLVTQEDNKINLELVVPENLLYFDGHFSIAPILPGVVQIEWAIHFSLQFFSMASSFKGMQNIKFQQVIPPKKIIHLELAYIAEKKAIEFRYFSDIGQHASGRILFK